MAAMWNRIYIAVLCLVLTSVAAAQASTPETIWQFDTAG